MFLKNGFKGAIGVCRGAGDMQTHQNGYGSRMHMDQECIWIKNAYGSRMTLEEFPFFRNLRKSLKRSELLRYFRIFSIRFPNL